MNGELYFEEHPWSRACTCISEKNLGPVYEIAIQAVCQKGCLQETFENCVKRIETLLNTSIKGETLSTDKVVSYVGRGGDCIIRIFADESDTEETENFEIVTEKALLVWKPGTSLQGRTSGGYTLCKQQYTIALEAES